jgi:glycosyltransferase involved in cell wall biosynthesis
VKVLISAYACEPGKGSEAGAGWNWATAAAEHHDVWVVTRANNRPAIEEELRRRPRPSLHFAYVDLPPWARRWKRGARGVRLYYLLWQAAAFRTARRLQSDVGFDVVHHITFANIWLPAFGAYIGPPFVLGPVGGGPRVPLRLYPELGSAGMVKEASLQAGRYLSLCNPLVRATWRRARVILAQNEETRAKLVGRTNAELRVHPHASVDATRLTTSVGDVAETPTVAPPRALYAGRLLPWKGVSLVLRALAELPDWHLEIVGSGQDETRLRKLARQLGVDERVMFTGWLSQEELWRSLVTANALVHPSLRDDSPLILAEALALGIPIVALDQGGPRVIAEHWNATSQLVRLGARRQLPRDIRRALRTCEEGSRAADRVMRVPPPLASLLDEVYADVSSNRARRPISVAGTP